MALRDAAQPPQNQPVEDGWQSRIRLEGDVQLGIRHSDRASDHVGPVTADQSIDIHVRDKDLVGCTRLNADVKDALTRGAGLQLGKVKGKL